MGWEGVNKSILIKIISGRSRISKTGARSPKDGAPAYRFNNFFYRKLHENGKRMDREEGSSLLIRQ